MKPAFRAVNPKAERAALGCALAGDEAARHVAGLPPAFFTSERYRKLQAGIGAVLARQDGLDPVTLSEELRKLHAWTDDATSSNGAWTMTSLLEMQDQSPPPAQAKAYGRLLRDAARQRHIVTAAREILDNANQRLLSGEELAAVEERWQAQAFATARANPERQGPEPLKDILQRTLTGIQDVHEKRSSGTGISTGFSKLDQYTSGLHPGEMWIAAGRPGSGKTAFILDVALCATKSAPVLIFSLEMSTEQLGQRLISKRTAVDLMRIRAGSLESYDFEKIVHACGPLSECAVYVDDSPELSPGGLRFKVRELGARLKQAPGLVIVDYLQLLQPDHRHDSREREVSAISRALKLSAKELGIPLLVCCQLNREAEKRTDKRPQLSDLRESGGIEQDADVVILLHLPYRCTDRDEDRHKAEVILAKQRNGPIGSLELHWSPETATFHDVKPNQSAAL